MVLPLIPIKVRVCAIISLGIIIDFFFVFRIRRGGRFKESRDNSGWVCWIDGCCGWITDGYLCSTPQVNTEDYFCNFVIDAEESLDLDEDEEEDLDALDDFEAILDPDQNITAEGLDQDEEMDEDEDEEEESEVEDEYESEGEDEEQDMDDDSDDSELVTIAMTNEWSAAALKKSPLAWKKMLLAFRSIVRSDEDTPKQFTYRVESSKGKFELVPYNTT